MTLFILARAIRPVQAPQNRHWKFKTALAPNLLGIIPNQPDRFIGHLVKFLMDFLKIRFDPSWPPKIAIFTLKSPKIAVVPNLLRVVPNQQDSFLGHLAKFLIHILKIRFDPSKHPKIAICTLKSPKIAPKVVQGLNRSTPTWHFKNLSGQAS